MRQEKVLYNGKIYHVEEETKDMFCIVTCWVRQRGRLLPLQTKNVSKAECEQL